MPVLMPTLEEAQNIPSHKRERIIRAILRILAEVDDVADETTAEAYSAHAFGQRVREMAHQLEKYQAKEPNYVIAERRRIALEATK